jgi:hypothetical protein
MRNLGLVIAACFLLSGCALGAGTAATAGYALKAKTAEELTSAGEERIVERAKKETITELQAKGFIKNPN